MIAQELKKYTLTMNRLTLICLMVSLLVGACKKYDEGPLLSLRSRKARLAGKWEKEVGDDILVLTALIHSYEFKKDGVYLMEYDKGPTTTQVAVGTWEFYNKDQFLVTYLPEVRVRTAVFSMRDTLKILRLRRDELWLTSEGGSEKNFVRLE